MKAKTVVIIVLVVLFLILLIQNVQVVYLRFLFWKISMSRIVFYPLILLTGFLLGYITAKIRK
ncbi:MAG: DUF1049 domain-containing protein [candidate division KSB1 bacterium]|nr:DUF1049 domain-containing protein [candidate division KSB1 bacterium]MDZ7318581.1 DUF1049 domain-containing protein [candidate division KSB1 bacterium]MDZ7339717.1 DUF1049 domain-containing protein [candidate division KSB1 bacterium]